MQFSCSLFSINNIVFTCTEASLRRFRRQSVEHWLIESAALSDFLFLFCLETCSVLILAPTHSPYRLESNRNFSRGCTHLFSRKVTSPHANHFCNIKITAYRIIVYHAVYIHNTNYCEQLWPAYDDCVRDEWIGS